jgi:hypothetical protein
MSEIKYIFMVGFPRSGTTLAQSIVMCDNNVYSIPETHLFTKGVKFGRLPEFLTNLWTTWYCYQWVKRCFAEKHMFYSTSKTKLISSFFDFLENKAKENNKSIILEKTPGHLNHIDYISSIFGNAQFVHVTRSYKGAIPSKLKATKQWGGNDNLLFNMRRWISEIFASISYTNEFKHHVLIDFDEMISDRKRLVEKLNLELGLEIEDVTDEKLAEISHAIIEPSEIWKKNNLRGSRVDHEPDLTMDNAIKKFVDYMNRTSAD